MSEPNNRMTLRLAAGTEERIAAALPGSGCETQSEWIRAAIEEKLSGARAAPKRARKPRPRVREHDLEILATVITISKWFAIKCTAPILLDDPAWTNMALFPKQMPGMIKDEIDATKETVQPAHYEARTLAAVRVIARFFEARFPLKEWVYDEELREIHKTKQGFKRRIDEFQAEILSPPAAA